METNNQDQVKDLLHFKELEAENQEYEWATLINSIIESKSVEANAAVMIMELAAERYAAHLVQQANETKEIAMQALRLQSRSLKQYEAYCKELELLLSEEQYKGAHAVAVAKVPDLPDSEIPCIVQQAKDAAFKWISVEDGLPELGEFVFVNIEGQGTFKGRLMQNGWTAFYIDGEHLVSINEVTHWMPEPESPYTTGEKETIVTWKEAIRDFLSFCIGTGRIHGRPAPKTWRFAPAW